MEESESPVRLLVRNIPLRCSDEKLLMFFESKRIFGRYLTVTHVDYDQKANRALITFPSNADLQTVLNRHKHTPCCLQGNQLRIEVYEDQTTTLTSTIEVTGYPKTNELDRLKYYFENTRRSGGGHVDDVTTETGSDDTIHVTFTDATAVESVMKRANENGHEIGQYRITVRPLTMSDTEMLLSNIPRDLPEETIKDFLSVKLDNEALSLTYGSSRDAAVVKFETAIADFANTQDKLSQHPCGGRYLRAGRVPVTNCLFVRQLPDGATEEAFRHYFENKRKSGAGPVRKIVFNQQDGYCLIYLENERDAQSACDKPVHKLLGQTMDVSLYHTCLGPPTPIHGDSITIPDTIEVDKDIEIKVKLVARTPEGRGLLEARLGEHYGKIVGTPMKIECTLTTDVSGYRQLIKSWEDTIQTTLCEFVCDVDRKQFDLDHETFDLVRDRLMTLVLQHPEKSLVVVKRTQYAIILVSFKNVFQDSCMQIEKTINAVEQQLSLSKNQITKEYRLKTWQVQYLNRTSFSNKIKPEYPNLSLTFDIDNGIVLYKGLDTDITGAALEMYQLLQNVREHNIKLPTEAIALLTKEHAKERLDKELEYDNISRDQWRVAGDSIRVVIDESVSINAVESIFRNFYTVLDIPLNSDPVLQDSEKLDELLDSLSKKFNDVLVIARHRRKVSLVMIPKHSDSINAHLQRYLSENNIMELKLHLDEHKLKFTLTYLQAELSQGIRDIQKDHNVNVNYGDGGNIFIKGTQVGNKLMRQLFERLDRNVSSKQRKMEQPGINRFLKSKHGKEAMTTIEKTTPCLILVDVIRAITHKESFKQGIQCAEVKLQTGQKIIVYGGDMTGLKVDVLVNASNIQMNHAGGLAAAVVKAGGQKIQDECTAHVKNNGSLAVGDVYMGQPGKLRCRAVAHTVGPRWTGGQKGEPKTLISLVGRCLRETEKMRLASIAFPALCTGMFKYPVDQSCADIVTSVLTYFQANRSSIKEVFLCDINVTTVHGFIKALKSTLPNVTQLVQLDDRDKSQTSTKSSASGTGHAPRRTNTNPTFTVGNGTVELVKGDIAYEKVDVIVNSTSPDLKLAKGQTSKTLLKHGGKSIQTECDQKFPKGVTHGEVAVTTAGSLRCNELYHVTVLAHKETNSLQTLASAVSNSLLTADKAQRKSIAFPAIGTGAQGFPKDVSADCMFNAIVTYFSNTPNTSLTRTRVVVYRQDTETYDAFAAEFKKFVAKYPTKAAAPKDATDPGQPGPNLTTTMHLGSFNGGHSGESRERCDVTVYAAGREAIERAFDRIEKVVKSEWYTHTIQDNAVWKLDQSQIKKIDAAAKANDVYVCVDTDIGSITIEGLLKHASTVTDVVCAEIRAADQSQHELQHAQLKAKVVRWAYVNGSSSTVEFPEIENYRIEMAHSNKANTLRLKNAAGDEYEINFKNLTMYFLKQSATQFRVHRKNLTEASFKLPADWDPMQSGEKLRMVQLSPTSAEYKKAVSEFQSTLGRVPNIMKVERVQNGHLYAQYDIKRAEMKIKNPGIQNERVLWHGTDVAAIQNIIANGFNRSYLSYGAYGAGVYFAVNSSYSDGGYAKVDTAGHKRMLRCLVLVGQSVRGGGGLTYLPERQPGVLYDSASDNPSGPSMFIIFNDTQAYVQHIITYT